MKLESLHNEKLKKEIEHADEEMIHFFRKISDPLSRFALFIVYFWFGMLKVFDLSPAADFVKVLFDKTVSWISFPNFMIIFGLFEMIIGLMFIKKGYERRVLFLLVFHMILTIMPLFILPTYTWHNGLIPTMEAQYIIKNIALIACAVAIMSHMHPLRRRVGEKVIH